jgi:CheY-like chemotaxis protein
MADTKRVLLCDDDPAILRVLQVNLEIEGYDTLLAHHGEEALAIAQAEHPDLIILDIMMPRMDGYETCDALKTDDKTKDIPIVFLSAKAQDADIERGRTHKVEDYLTKPFDPDRLIEVVERLIG